MRSRFIVPILLLMLVTSCDEDEDSQDPATTERCVIVRMKYIERKYLLELAAERGATAGLQANAVMELEQYRSKNFECFK